jgi:tetratricopeptide (TPR) repeat protein
MSNWEPFPFDQSVFTFEDDKLKQAWSHLHGGDCTPYPQDEALQEAWRCFHRGDFEQAVTLADALGIAAHGVANKATGVYATYLEPDEKQQIACFKSAIARAELAIGSWPEDPNSHYFHAFNLGRYSQSISVLKALKQGVGTKIANSLHKTLELQPKHAEAHTALGMYHAEIIDKVGKLIGSMTYGANEDEAVEHFETALALTPDSPIAHIEYGNGLYLIFGEGKLDKVTDLYIKATEMLPKDAMEKLDIEAALAELE